MTKARVMVMTGGWDPASPCTALRSSVTVMDGPHTEAKEVIAGFAVFDVKSKEEAVDWAKRFLKVAGHGTTEMRELYDAGPR